MLIETIDSLIADSRKNGNQSRMLILQEIKAELTKLRTSGKPYTEVGEMELLGKMVKKYKDAINEFKEASSDQAKSLVEEYTVQLAVIEEFAPKSASEEDIISEVNKSVDRLIANGITPSMKEMKIIMKEVKDVYPTADGAIISKIFRSRL